MPPDMPAAKLRPVGPRITARPPVMYSQPWSPTPSTTAHAPLLRTQNRSAARPQKNAWPLGGAVQADVANQDVPLGAKVLDFGGYTMSRPPDSPLPT